MANMVLPTASLSLNAVYYLHVCRSLEMLCGHQQKKRISDGSQRWKEKLGGQKAEHGGGGEVPGLV